MNHIFTIALLAISLLGDTFAISKKENTDETTQITGLVSVTATQLDTGTASVTVSATRIKGYGILIRVLRPGDTTTCDPYSSVIKPLDIRDSYNLERDITPSVSGQWTIMDTEDGHRSYSARLSPATLRQQFMVPIFGSTSMGAVTGGSVAATVYTCVFKKSSGQYTAENQGAVDVVGFDKATFESKSGADAPSVDVRAAVMNPVSTSKDPITGKEVATMTIETRTSYQASCASLDQNAGAVVPYLVHTESSMYGRQVNPNEKKDKKGRSVTGKCDSITIGPGGCSECVQRMDIPVPVSDDISRPFAMYDLISRFAAYLKDEKSMFVIHFVVPANGELLSARDVHHNKKCGNEVMCAIPDEENKEKTITTETREVKAQTQTARVVTEVLSGGKSVMRADRRWKRSETPETVPTMEILSADLIQGKEVCMRMSVEGTLGQGSIIKIVSASMKDCHKSGDDNAEQCSELSIVRDGSIDGEMYRFARARVHEHKKETKLCFVPNIAVGDTIKMTVTWKAVDGTKHHVVEETTTTTTTKNEDGEIKQDPDTQPTDKTPKTVTAKPRTIARGPPPPPPHDDGHGGGDHHGHKKPTHHPMGGPELLEWCVSTANCTGMVIMDATMMCGHNFFWDGHHGRCMAENANDFLSVLTWAWIPIVLVIIITIIIIAICVSFTSSSPHAHVEHAHMHDPIVYGQSVTYLTPANMHDQ